MKSSLRFSNTARTGTRVPLNTQAPLTVPAFCSIEGTSPQSKHGSYAPWSVRELSRRSMTPRGWANTPLIWSMVSPASWAAAIASDAFRRAALTCRVAS